MGKGVTNSVGGEAASSTDPATSTEDFVLWHAEVFSAGFHCIILLFSLVCVIFLRVNIKRKCPHPEGTSKSEQSIQVCATKVDLHLTRDKNEQYRSECGKSFSQTCVSEMDRPTDSDIDPTRDVSDQQPDSFFTWDSGGSSGEYSFVHTAVELPKYSDHSISEEERQMLLLYMRTGHPELLLSTSTHNSTVGNGISDPALARSFLETIFEENSDDLRSPSECDEASIGWGSWDESDEDRLTVVEMVTTDERDNGTPSDISFSPLDKSQCSGNPVCGQPNGDLISFRIDNQLPDFSSVEETVSNVSDYQFESVTSTQSYPVCKLKDKNKIQVLENNQLDIITMASLPSDTDGSFFTAIKDDATSDASVSSNSNKLLSSNSNFDELWVKPNEFKNSVEKQLDAWVNCEFPRFIDSPTEIPNIKISSGEETLKTTDSLVILGSDDICLVPSKENKINLESDNQIFSDNFKDYFLPSENYIFDFDKPTNPPPEITNNNMRFLRMGFDHDPVGEIQYDSGNEDPENLNFELNGLESENDKNNAEDTVFSPAHGDIVFGSAWASEGELKEQEISSGAEVHSLTIQTNAHQSFSTDNNRRTLSLREHWASDDDDPVEVPNSLSRWRHHTDLQHLQEGTSPLTRWQHETKTSDSDDGEDELPVQLKEMYTSFKMKGSKGRVRIKDNKNNDFSKLGFWDSDTKVTLPPFDSEGNSLQKENSNPGELDDLEFDMFSTNKCNRDNTKTNCDSDVDDALESFNHLNDYSSQSEDGSGSENNHLFVSLGTISFDAEPISQNDNDSESKNFQSLELITESEAPNSLSHCSDNSDNCPLCMDADIFSKNNVERDVQYLLQKTYPKMTRLSDSLEETSQSKMSSDSASIPTTSSDSDESLRKMKEFKKRVKKRSSKDTSNSELKHDDSGYVEDDEDDEEDSFDDKKDNILSVESKSRKSLSSVFNEFKCNQSDLSSFVIPETFQKFSVDLEQLVSKETPILETTNIAVADESKIPENISRFSAWLLDKELKELNNRQEMEKLLVNDIIKLREQTILQYLKTSRCNEEKVISENFDVTKSREILKAIKSLNLKCQEIDNEITAASSTCFNFESSEKSNDTSDLIRDAINNKNDRKIPHAKFENEAKNSGTSDDESSKNKSDSDNSSLGEEYYSYNYNNNVSKMFKIQEKIASLDSEFTDASAKCIQTNVSNKCTDSSDTTPNIHTSISDNFNYTENKNAKFEIIHSCHEMNENYEKECEKFGDSADSHMKMGLVEDDGLQTITRLPPASNPTYHDASGTGEILPKVNNTTIKGKQNEEREIAQYHQLSVTGSIDDGKNGDELPSSEGNSKYSDDKQEVSNLVGDSCDLMTPRAREGKGESEGCDELGETLTSHDIKTLEATAVNEELGRETHVDINAQQKFVENNIISNRCEPEKNNADEAQTDNEINSLKCLCDAITEVEVNSEGVDKCVPASIASALIHENLTAEKGFTSLNCSSALIPEEKVGAFSIINHTKKVSAEVTDIVTPNESAECYQNDDILLLEREPCDNIEILSTEVESNIHEIELRTDKSENILHTNKLTSNSCSEKINSEEKPECQKVSRPGYKRSSSLGRDENIEVENSFEPISTHSKSTPDLRRCHEQYLNSSVPLSALLSKSVSQRKEDYFRSSTRGGLINRSLPPHERSRHYRRICVSTETVVERAARFEARSKSSNGVKEHLADNNTLNSRSGSCPPVSMRNNTSWISDRTYNKRCNKPTATVKPLDISVNGDLSEHSLLPDKTINNGDKNIFETITGYSKASKVTHKPPVPPTTLQLQHSMKTARLKGKIASARRNFFERLSSQPNLSKSRDSIKTEDSDEEAAVDVGLKRFDAFRRSAREERARLASSHPDLGALEAAVRASSRSIDAKTKSGSRTPAPDSAEMPSSTDLRMPYRRCTGEIAWASCSQRLREARAAEKKRAQQYEIVDVRAQPGRTPEAEAIGVEFLGSRARSMDFLLDAENRERAQPPENKLSGRVKSEHELRVERSLQNLTLPDWYKQSKKAKEGFILRRGSEGAAGESRKRWQGFSSSRTPSATSLTAQSYSQRNIVVPKRVTPTPHEWRSLVSSRESLTPASPASLSPRDAFQYGLSSSLSRWSSSRLSTSSAPITALSVHRSFRQPYLGWRAAAAASSSGGGSRSSPGVSPINATTPLPGSPRRGSQEQQYGYGLQQNQITNAATLRPESNESCDVNRISPLALHTTNVFFNSHIEPPPSSIEMRRDRYSYTQSLYTGTIIVSPDRPLPDDNYNSLETTPEERFQLVPSPQPPPRVWMESSFVGCKSNEPAVPVARSIRIVPSDTATRNDNSVRGSTCATQTAMGYQKVSISLTQEKRHSLIEYETEPKGYPRGSWRHSSSSSKDISPENSSTDNELWLSVGDDPHRVFRVTHPDASSRSSVSPPSPPTKSQKRVSEDSTGSPRPIFFASSRRGSKGSNADKSDSSSYHHQQSFSSTPLVLEMDQQKYDTKNSSVYKNESGFIRRDSSKSGGSNGWKESRMDQESSSAASYKGDRSSASMEEVLESLLAIPPTNSRTSSPTSPRRFKGPTFQQPLRHSNQENVLKKVIAEPSAHSMFPQVAEDHQRKEDDANQIESNDPGKMLADSLSFPPPIPSSSSSAKQLLCSPLEEVNHGSYFCRSSSTSPLEDDIQSPTSMEVLVPEGEEQELSSIIEGRGPSLTTTTDDHGATVEVTEITPTRKKKLTRGIANNGIANEGHLKCHRPKCTKSLPVEEARAKFRTCPNCYTYYCSRQCRKLHLSRHKDHCPQTRISNLCKQVLMKARDDPISRRHLSLCAKRGLLSRGRGAVKLLFLCPEDALDYLVHGWECAKGQTLYVSRSDLLPHEMGSEVFSQVRNFCDKYNPERKFILLAAITVTNEIAVALEREVVIRGAKMHLSPSLPEDDVQTLILTITKTDPETGDPAHTTEEDRKVGLGVVVEQLSARGVDLEKLYPHTYRKIMRFVTENEPFAPISIFPTDQRNGRVFMCIVLPWADPDIILNISAKSGVSGGKSSKKKWMS